MRALLVALCALFIAASARAETITLAADVWCPYNCEPDSDMPGFAVEIARIAFGGAGYKLDYVVMPWARAKEEGRANRVTGIIGAFKEDAPDYVFPAEPLTVSGNDFFVKRGNPWKYSGMDSLKQGAVGVIRDYSYGEEFDAYVEAHKKQLKRIQIVGGATALEQNIKKLMADRVQILIEDKAVMGYMLATMGLKDKIVPAGSLGYDNLYIAFSPKNPNSPEYARILSDTIAQMRADGRLKAIMDKYGMTDQ